MPFSMQMDSQPDVTVDQRVQGWMDTLAAAPLPAAPVRSAAYVWFKAQLLARWEVEARLRQAPLEWADRVQLGFGLAGAVGLLAAGWSRGTSATGLGLLVTSTLVAAAAAAATALGHHR